jgi:hypothetical protein
MNRNLDVLDDLNWIRLLDFDWVWCWNMAVSVEMFFSCSYIAKFLIVMQSNLNLHWVWSVDWNFHFIWNVLDDWIRTWNFYFSDDLSSDKKIKSKY